MAAAQVCLVVPCYNEGRRLDVEAFRRYLADTPESMLLFVNDGSTDDTAAVLKAICAGVEGRAVILACEINAGKAEAVRRGILHSLDHWSAGFVGFWDADLATPLEAARGFLNVFHERPEIQMVFGSRVKLLGRRVERKAYRHYLGRVFATAVSTMLGLPIYDTQCGAKIFRKTPEVRSAFAEKFISKWVFDVEILARYLQFYRREPRALERVIYEYPLETWVDIAGSKVGPMDFITAFVDVLRIRYRYLA